MLLLCSLCNFCLPCCWLQIEDVKQTCGHDPVLMKMMEGVLMLRDESFALLRMSDLFSVRGVKVRADFRLTSSALLLRFAGRRRVNPRTAVPAAVARRQHLERSAAMRAAAELRMDATAAFQRAPAAASPIILCSSCRCFLQHFAVDKKAFGDKLLANVENRATSKGVCSAGCTTLK